MIQRPFWLQILEQAWKRRSLIWLSGVRRVGKTTLARMLPGPAYFNCDLPSVARLLNDPESVFRSLSPGSTVVFDEIHRLDDPSRILKIGTDEFPHLRMLATGSSTLEASQKFSDSLTGRKVICYLPPVLWDECEDPFGIPGLDARLLHGGLPESLLSGGQRTDFFSEWMDSFYARDIQELFRIRQRGGFIRLLHLLFRSSGSLINQTNLARDSGLTRPTVVSYLEALRISNAIFLLSPFHGGKKREITSQPKCYAFDTGFVNHVKGWTGVREEDRGLLWEHLVLDMLRTVFPSQTIQYWRDKSGREIDFTLPGTNGSVDIFECKIQPDNINPAIVGEFRKAYPKGRNYCFSPWISRPYAQTIHGLKIEFIGRAGHL